MSLNSSLKTIAQTSAMSDKCIQEVDLQIFDASNERDETKSRHTAKLVRPATEAEFFSRLNVWVMTCHATGLANSLISTAFLEEVVYTSIRKGLLR